MSERWAERQRRTNRLVRALFGRLDQGKIVPDHIYGLCKLTWITKSFEDDHATYIRSTKLPALGLILGRDYARASLVDAADDLTQLFHSEAVGDLTRSHTGFTNLYPAYRNAARGWIHSHFDTLLPMFRDAFFLNSDEAGFELASRIESLPGIPRGKDAAPSMKAEYLLTPAFFSLDNRIRFPLINGNDGVRKLLSRLKVHEAPLSQQYLSMVALYGVGGIQDAADLDQPGRHLADFVGEPGAGSRKRLLEPKPVDPEHELPLKDEADIVFLQQARTVECKRIHNALTNRLKNALAKFTLLEGHSQDAMFDVLVKGYPDEKEDLLIEVKVSDDAPHVRMALGQVFDYWLSVKGTVPPRVAILTPERPCERTTRLLDWLGVGSLWFSDDVLETNNDWLAALVAEAE